MNTRNYYSSLLLSFLIPAVVMVGMQQASAQDKDEAYQTEKFKVTSGQVSLEVQTSGGSIKVIGSQSDEVTVEMYVRRRGRYIEPGQANLEDYDISNTQDGNTIRVIAERKSGWGWNNDNYSISYIVYVPVETRTRLKTSGGSLTARNMEGSQELRTSGGTIVTEGIRGKMLLKTSGGSIHITDSQGHTEANTSGGTIYVDALYGNLNAKTSGGSIRLKGIEGSVEAYTSGGSINAEILEPVEFIKLKTSGGSISITVPEELGYDLDLDANHVSVNLKNFNGRTERDEIKGSMNGGGILIQAKTSGGSIGLDYL